MSDKKKELKPNTYKFDTLSLHAGYQPHKNAGSRQVPIYQTTSSYGHFGRKPTDKGEFSWEKTDKADLFK